MPVSLMVALRQLVEPLSSSLTSFVVPKNDLSTPHGKRAESRLKKRQFSPHLISIVTFDRLKCFHTLFKCNICVAQCNNSICFSAHNSNSLKPSIHRHFSII